MDELTFKNRKSLEEAKMCVCIDCLYQYHVHKILNWTDNGQTAICPHCWDDTVIPFQYDEQEIVDFRSTYIERPSINAKITYTEKPGCSIYDFSIDDL